MKLADKVCIVTGSGSGIGRVVAVIFAREGAKIVVADIDDFGGKETVKAIQSNDGVAFFVHTDVSVESEVRKLVQHTKERYGKLHILLNNAGLGQKPTSVEHMDESLWDRIYGVNVKGIFLTVKHAVPVMKELGGGVIINVASISGVRPRMRSSAYTSSKAAAIHLTKALALELAQNNIRVNAINPVAIDTPMLTQIMPEGKDKEEFRLDLLKTVPLGRLATPEDVAYAALYLASDKASMLTGTCIDVDGGRGI